MLIQGIQSSWANDFERIKEIIMTSLNIEGLVMEHIGSTSIKGLSAKPIIDTDIAYEKTVSFDTIE